MTLEGCLWRAGWDKEKSGVARSACIGPCSRRSTQKALSVFGTGVHYQVGELWEWWAGLLVGSPVVPQEQLCLAWVLGEHSKAHSNLDCFYSFTWFHWQQWGPASLRTCDKGLMTQRRGEERRAEGRRWGREVNRKLERPHNTKTLRVLKDRWPRSPCTFSGCQDWRDRLTDLAQSADTLGRGPFTLCRATFTEQTAAEALSTQSGVPWSLAPASAGVEGSAEQGETVSTDTRRELPPHLCTRRAIQRRRRWHASHPVLHANKQMKWAGLSCQCSDTIAFNSLSVHWDPTASLSWC